MIGFAIGTITYFAVSACFR